MQKVLATLGRAGDLALLIAGVAILAMTLLVAGEVISRGLLNVSTLVADEWSGYLLALLTFLGFPYAFRTGAFIRAEWVYARLHGRSRPALDLAHSIVGLAYVAVVGYFVWVHVLRVFRSGTTSEFITRTPLWIPQSVMVIGLGLLALQLATNVVRCGLQLVSGAAASDEQERHIERGRV